jgi:hypothetical protein
MVMRAASKLEKWTRRTEEFKESRAARSPSMGASCGQTYRGWGALSPRCSSKPFTVLEEKPQHGDYT